MEEIPELIYKEEFSNSDTIDKETLKMSTLLSKFLMRNKKKNSKNTENNSSNLKKCEN